MDTFIWGAGKEAGLAIDFCRSIVIELSVCVDSDVNKYSKTYVNRK